MQNVPQLSRSLRILRRMTAQHVKRIIGLLLLGGLITYFGIKLFSTVDDTFLALFILAAVCFVVVLVVYVLNK